MPIRFRDSRAEKWLRSGSQRLLELFTDNSLPDIQTTIAVGLENGSNPKKVGLDLVGRINPESGKREGGPFRLSQVGIQTLQEYRRCLLELDTEYFNFELRDKRSDRPVRNSFYKETPLGSDKIDLLVNRFHAKLLKHEADMIARTTMIAALNRSEWISTREAIEKSEYPFEAMTRIWDSCGDDKVRPSHKLLDGQRIVGAVECFISPLSGARMMHPGDTSLGAPKEELEGCRCRVRYEIDWGYNLRTS